MFSDWVAVHKTDSNSGVGSPAVKKGSESVGILQVLHAQLCFMRCV